MFCLGKNHQLCITHTLQVLWPNIPNASQVMSVTKHCMHADFNVTLLLDYTLRKFNFYHQYKRDKKLKHQNHFSIERLIQFIDFTVVIIIQKRYTRASLLF